MGYSPAHTDRIRMSPVREHLLECHRTVHVYIVLIGQGEHVAGRAELGQVAASDGELPPCLQAVRVHQLELDLARERGHGVQAGRVQGNAEHVLLVQLRQ